MDEVVCSGSNRTFMELKHVILSYLTIFNHGSNRTFMELKHSFTQNKCIHRVF